MNERITVRITPEVKDALERFHQQQQLIPMRSRQDAFRHIIEDWLAAHGYLARRTAGGDEATPHTSAKLPSEPHAASSLSDSGPLSRID